VLLGASAAFAVLILVKTTSFFVVSARAESLVKRVAAQNGPNAQEMREYVAKSGAIADELKKRNLFAPPPPKQHPVSSVLGILGNEALIGDRWYKVGDRVKDARIVAIEPTQVRIEWEGRQKVFAPIQSTVQSDSGRPQPMKRGAREVTEGRKAQRKFAEMVQIGRNEIGSGGGRPNGILSEEERAKLDRKAEKQRLSAEKKEFGKLLKRDTKKLQTGQDKSALRSSAATKDKAAQQKKKAKADDRKPKDKTAEKKTKKPAPE
jgi:hypothetical protein